MEGIEKETECMEAKDIPEVGKVYHWFDDGKIRLSRHCLMECVEVIPFKQFITDPKYAELFQTWQEEVKECDWLYAQTTDYIVVCKVMDDPDDELVYYARTTDGDWFGFGTMLDDGILDTDRTRWKYWIDYVRSGQTEYSTDEIKEMEEADKY